MSSQDSQEPSDALNAARPLVSESLLYNYFRRSEEYTGIVHMHGRREGALHWRYNEELRTRVVIVESFILLMGNG